MGLNASSDEFCQRTDAALAGLSGVLKIVDDILIMAETKEELAERIEAVLSRCKDVGITLSRNKVKVGTSMKFAGFIVSSDGAKPDPDKVKAVTEFKPPTDTTSLRSFLGMALQLAHFIPDFSHMTVNLRQLLKKETPFIWLEDHQKAFEDVKRLLSSPMILHYYDPNKPTELHTDASRLYGLGYALIQRNNRNHPLLIECGSRSLKPAEKNYATVELEALAVRYAVDKCKFYLAGHPSFTVVVDHRPLEGIFKKPLAEIDNKRLLNYREKLLDYSFNVKWVQGKNHQLADALSRFPVFAPPEEAESEVTEVNACVTLADDPSFAELIQVANKDSDYQMIIAALKSGKRLATFPTNHPARAYKNFWDEISLHDDLLIFRANRIIIPVSLRKKFLGLLHQAHAGIYKTRKLAQCLYFWPGINRDIEEMIARCDSCQERRPSQPEEPLQLHPVPDKPMESVAADLYDCKGQKYLILVDRYSGFPFVHHLRSTITGAITKALENWFLDFGWPTKMITDGGPQFRSEFKEFCKQHHIIYEPSSAFHPQSNGLAEAGVKRCKSLLEKVDSFQEFRRALLQYRNVPRSDTGLLSPAELFFGRRQRRQLPELPSPSIIPTKPPAPSIESINSHRKEKSKLGIGQKVLVQDALTKRWNIPGIIKERRKDGRSYIISRDEGFDLLRNRKFIKEDPKALFDKNLKSKNRKVHF